MQDSSPSCALTGLANWLARLTGERLPERVHNQAACSWLCSSVFWMLIVIGFTFKMALVDNIQGERSDFIAVLY